MRASALIPYALTSISVLNLVLVILRSELLTYSGLGTEPLFVFSSMTMLVQPIPTLAGGMLSQISFLPIEKPYFQVTFSALTGCTQWWLIGIGIRRLLEIKKRNVLQLLTLSELSTLSLVFFIYVISLLFQLDDLRPQIEITFILLWALALILLVLSGLTRLVILARSRLA